MFFRTCELEIKVSLFEEKEFICPADKSPDVEIKTPSDVIFLPPCGGYGIKDDLWRNPHEFLLVGRIQREETSFPIFHFLPLDPRSTVMVLRFEPSLNQATGFRPLSIRSQTIFVYTLQTTFTEPRAGT